MLNMATVTLPKNEYIKIISAQKTLERGFARLEKFVFQIAKDEINPEYSARLDKIEKQVASGKVKKFKNKSELKKFFASL